MVLGYTSGVFDLFHIGHVNILRNARSMCDRLVVAVTTDELLLKHKGKRPVIPFTERCEVVRAIKYADVVIAQETMDKFAVWEKIKFDIMFVGDDWFRTDKWQSLEEKFRQVGVRIVYFPYTRGTSSTLINEILIKMR